MIRAVAATLLVLLACPLFAERMSQAELDNLFDKWQAEENRTLQGWRVLEDVTLIEKLHALVGVTEEGKAFRVKGPDRATVLLGVTYKHGVGGAPFDPRYAARLFRVVRGDDAAYARALAKWDFEITDEGKVQVRPGIARDEPQANYLAIAGTPAIRAMSSLGYLLHDDRRVFGFGHNGPDEAIADLELAAIDGCLPAGVALAAYLHRGVLVARDVVKAEQHLLAGAKADYMPALMALGDFYHFRNGVRPDLGKCRLYYERAARAGCGGAAEKLQQIPPRELDRWTVGELYEHYLSRWGNTVVAWTRELKRILRFEPNPLLKSYPNVAQWLRAHADPVDPADSENLDVARARCMLGECLLHGIGGVDADFDEAISLLRAAWRDGQLVPGALLAGLHLLGDQESDPNKDASKLLTDAVDSEFRPGLRLCALTSLKWESYAFEELGVIELRQNHQERVLFELAEAGDREALEWAMKRSDDLKWRRLGAAAGYPGAMLEYAFAIYRGRVEGAKLTEAEDLFRRCLGFPETHVAAKMHFEYEAAEPSAIRALELTAELKKCLNETGDYVRFLADNPYAAGVAQRSFIAGYETGELYALCLYEKHGLPVRTRSSEEILLSYPDSPLAVYLCGRQYEAADNARSAVWCYEAAANVGAGFAAQRLGQVYRRGKLKEQDDALATEWFIKGAENGSVIAMLEAAKAYHDGVGVEKDVVKAKEWAKKAADAGNEDAKALLDGWNK